MFCRTSSYSIQTHIAVVYFLQKLHSMLLKMQIRLSVMRALLRSRRVVVITKRSPARRKMLLLFQPHVFFRCFDTGLKQKDVTHPLHSHIIAPTSTYTSTYHVNKLSLFFHLCHSLPHEPTYTHYQ